MSAHTLHPLAADYLRRLRRAGRRLPRGRLNELVAEVEGHLSEAIGAEAGDAEALTVLDRLGSPEEIVEAEQPGSRPATDRRGTREWAAIILLLFGGFIFGIGWLVGLILLWSSRAWTTADKWIGTLIVPGGLAATFLGLVVVAGTSGQICSGYAGGPTRCTGGSGAGANAGAIVFLLVFVLGPIATAVYLARRAANAPPGPREPRGVCEQ